MPEDEPPGWPERADVLLYLLLLADKLGVDLGDAARRKMDPTSCVIRPTPVRGQRARNSPSMISSHSHGRPDGDPGAPAAVGNS